MTNITTRAAKRQKHRVPLCPHCAHNTMYLNRAGTRWQCADGAACGFTMPVISELRPVRFAEVA